MVTREVPVLDERDGRKAAEVHLTALCSWATVPMVASVACTFARGVTYACNSAAGEAPVGVPASANSGNYFEVTVMNPGEKTTIGIGLADPDVFPATKQMPGWVDHSYGYHGDDGRKFGRGKTDSIWPIWADGDVIGCGFDPARGAIWCVEKPAGGEMGCCQLEFLGDAMQYCSLLSSTWWLFVAKPLLSTCNAGCETDEPIVQSCAASLLCVVQVHPKWQAARRWFRSCARVQLGPGGGLPQQRRERASELRHCPVRV